MVRLPLTFKAFLEAEIKPMDAPEEAGNLPALADIVRKTKSYHPDGMPYIWRGVRNEVEASVLNPGSGQRGSQNTSNFYTVLLDENPENSKFPKRQNSFICTSNITVAKGYARAIEEHLLAVYPLDSEVAMVNLPDIWHVRLKLRRLGHIDTLVGLNRMIADVLGSDKSPDTTKGIIDAVMAMDPGTVRSEFMYHDAGGVSSAARNASDEEFRAMLAADLKDSYNYRDAGMSIGPVSEVPANSEVWFSGKCVVIPHTQLEEFKQLLLKE